MIKQNVIFTKDECEKIINFKKINYTDWNEKDRKYISYSILYSDETRWLFDKLKNYFENNTNEKIKNLKKDIHFHIFQKGCKFDIHNDRRESRLYGVGVILNDNFDGGDFKFYNDTDITLNKIQGNTYIFNSDTNHEITEILFGERKSILWFIQRENIIINHNTFI
jgi:hypothetical protein